MNDAHKLSFTAFGAKQRHGQRQNRHTIETFRRSERDIKYNSDWGYKDGQLTFAEDNFYHKPQISLNHYWDINENNKLSTLLMYLSVLVVVEEQLVITVNSVSITTLTV